VIIRYRSHATQTGVGAGNIVVTKPAGTVDNDWLIGVSACAPAQTINASTFTVLYAHPSGLFNVGYRLAAAEAANYTFTKTGGSGDRAGSAAVVSYQGGDATTPPTVGVVTLGTASSSVTGKGLTIPTRGALLLHIGWSTQASGNSVTSTPPPGFKERVDLYAEDGGGGGTVQVQLSISERYVLPGQFADAIATLTSPRDNAGVLLVLYQVPLTKSAAATSLAGTLVEMDSWDEGAAAVATKKYSDFGATFSGGEFYENRIMNPVEIAQQALATVGAGGGVVTTVSEIDLDNKDGALDGIIERNLAIERTVTIKRVPSTSFSDSAFGAGAVSNAETVFVGVVAGLRRIGTVVRLSVSDLTSRLNVIFQQNTYSGAAGLGGDAELKGVTQPFTGGRCYNVEPQALGTINLGDGALYTYHTNDGNIQGHVEVRERGVEMVKVTGVAPGVGQWRDWPDDGVFQLGFTPNGIITCDIQGDDNPSYGNQHGELVNKMINQYGPLLNTSELDVAGTFADIDAVMPGEAGLHIRAGSTMTCMQAVELVLRSGVIWLYGGRNKKLKLALASPGPAEQLYLTEADIARVEPKAAPPQLQPAPLHVDMRAEINWTYPMSDISSGVTAGQRRKLASPGKTQRSTSTVVQTRQLPERVWSFAGLWRFAADATTRADQLRTWAESGLLVFDVETDRFRNQAELGMGVMIESYPRYGLEAGFSGIIAGWVERPATGRTVLTIIGLPNGYELREDGSAELREDGTLELRE
jgi:hypothetical protein